MQAAERWVETKFPKDSFVRSISQQALQNLLSSATAMRCPAGHIMFCDGDIADAAYILLQGFISLHEARDSNSAASIISSEADRAIDPALDVFRKQTDTFSKFSRLASVVRMAVNSKKEEAKPDEAVSRRNSHAASVAGSSNAARSPTSAQSSANLRWK